MKVYSPADLAENNGKDENKALVAVDGGVYDVSNSARWTGGIHMKRHQAGTDLSAEIKSAPHGLDVLQRFPKVGVIRRDESKRHTGLRARIEPFLERHPFFRRHPHPAIVHVPIGILCAAVPVSGLLALAAGSHKYEWCLKFSLALGLASLPAAIATGYFTWWLNYEFADSPLIRMKRRLAWVCFVLAATACLVRFLIVEEPLSIADPFTAIYCLNVAALTTLAGYVGFLGGKLTFPYE